MTRSCSTHRWVHGLTFIRDASSHSRDNWHRSHHQTMCSDRESLAHSTLNRMPLSSPSPQGPGTYAKDEAERLEYPEVMDDSKRTASPSHNKTDAQMDSRRLGQHAPGLHRFNPGKIPACEGGRGHKVPLLTKKPFASDTWWQRENLFSPVERHWIHQPHSMVGPMLRNNWAIQSGLQGFLWAFVVFWQCLSFWT